MADKTVADSLDRTDTLVVRKGSSCCSYMGFLH